MLLQVASRHLTPVRETKRSTVHKRSTLSAARKNARAAINAVKLPAHVAAREARRGVITTKAPQPPKEPSARPYREPEPVAKEKRVIHTVSEHDGLNLLHKIHGKGGRDIIVMMRDSERTPQELAESMMHDETIVIASLNAYGNGKDPIKRLLAAIEQAPAYLKNEGDRPVTTGVRQRKRQEEAQTKVATIASRRKNPKTRVHVAPTLAEVVPKRDDHQIVLEELKQYLGMDPFLRDRVTSASSDHKVARILMFNVGQRFDTRVKGLLAAPSEYQIFLAEAGATIRREARKYDTSDTALAGPALTVQESSEASGRHQSQRDAWEHFKKMDDAAKKVQPDPDDPELEEMQERFRHQEDILRRHLGEA